MTDELQYWLLGELNQIGTNTLSTLGESRTKVYSKAKLEYFSGYENEEIKRYLTKFDRCVLVP